MIAKQFCGNCEKRKKHARFVESPISEMHFSEMHGSLENGSSSGINRDWWIKTHRKFREMKCFSDGFISEEQ